LECTGGTCVCAARPGNKLGKYSSTYDPNLNVWTRDIFECSSEFTTICKKVDPTLPEPFFPEYSCTTSTTCSTGYAKVEPLCETP
jgi:hypothetical protein